MNNLEAIIVLEKNFNMNVSNPLLFEEALTHRSVSKKNNERLEFFGDAVLKFLASQYLYKKYPNWKEGNLTKLRAHLISDQALNLIASWLSLNKLINITEGSIKVNNNALENACGNAVEALIGALYIDQGLETTQNIVEPWLEKVEKHIGKKLPEDYKSQLQELLQKHQIKLPVYSIKDTEGPEHNKAFTVQVSINLNEGLTFLGKGKNKKEGEQVAAKHALNHLKNNLFYSWT